MTLETCVWGLVGNIDIHDTLINGWNVLTVDVKIDTSSYEVHLSTDEENRPIVYRVEKHQISNVSRNSFPVAAIAIMFSFVLVIPRFRITILLIRTGPIFGIPVIDSVLIPIIDFTLQIRNDTGLLRTRILMQASTFRAAETQFDIVVVMFPTNVIRQRSEACLSPSLQHAPMIPAAETDRSNTANYICENIKGIEKPVVGKKTLNYLGADSETECAD
jgi:hypothetical protein